MKKLYMVAIFSLFMVNDCRAESKKVFFINGIDEVVSVKGPFRKNDRYVSAQELKVGDVDLVEFDASNSELFYVRFLIGDRWSGNQVAKEFTTKLPKKHTAIILTKSVEKDKDGNEVTNYQAWKADAFTEAKLIEPKTF